jgi:hypothetical protein
MKWHLAYKINVFYTFMSRCFYYNSLHLMCLSLYHSFYLCVVFATSDLSQFDNFHIWPLPISF